MQEARCDPVDGLAQPVLESLRCAIEEAAVIGPGTGRWPGIDAWVVPLGGRDHVIGAARIEPALAADEVGREHATALASVLAQGLWRLRAAEAQLQAQAGLQRQELQSTFLAAVSHDFRTPLAAIVGAASSLQAQRERLTVKEQEPCWPTSLHRPAIFRGSPRTRCSSPASRRARALRLDWQSIEEIVGSVLAGCAPRRRTAGSRPRRRSLPLVRADAMLLAQLLTNLIDNACKYGTGPVLLSARRAPDEVVVRCGPRARHSPDDEARLFDMFYGAQRRRRARGRPRSGALPLDRRRRMAAR